MSLTDKTAIVTGAGRGLGYAIAKAYVNAGMRVALLDVREDLLNEVQTEFGEVAAAFPVDLSDGPDTQRVMRRVLEWHSTPDVLV
ncbi:MAG: SDR family NAD(P)-dependent oxidoreductase, partial [Chloroflexota bacterium]